MTDQKNEPECPYGDKDCPKVESIRSEIKSIKYTLYAITIFLVAKFGTDFLVFFGGA